MSTSEASDPAGRFLKPVECRLTLDHMGFWQHRSETPFQRLTFSMAFVVTFIHAAECEDG